MYPSPNILGWLDQGEDRWGMWLMGEKQNAYRIWWVNLNKRDNSQHLGVDGSIILKLVMNTYYGRLWTGFIGLRTQKRRGLINMAINQSVTYNASEILDYIGNRKIYWVRKLLNTQFYSVS